MRLLFNQDGKLAAYSKVGYSSKDDLTEIEKSESELNDLIPSSFEGDWEDNRNHLKLESGDIVFDESYESTSGEV